jgi:hypothetical protein
MQSIVYAEDPRKVVTPDVISMSDNLAAASLGLAPIPVPQSAPASDNLSFTTQDLKAPILSGVVDGVPVTSILADGNNVPTNDPAVAVTATSNGSDSTNLAAAVQNTDAATLQTWDTLGNLLPPSSPDNSQADALAAIPDAQPASTTGAAPGLVTDPTANASLDPNAPLAVAASASSIIDWIMANWYWLPIGGAVWYFAKKK